MSAKVIERLKRGSIAELLLARYVETDGSERNVVVKRLQKRHADDARARVSIAEEARLHAMLDHPNIAGFVDSGEADGLPYLVLERVDGLDLGAIAAQTSIPRDVALHVAAEILRALGYIHALADEDDTPLDIVHRDVTPGNVLVSWDGDVKLIDFGIAQQEERADLTLAGHHKGTVEFMAPEQSRGDKSDRRTDLYAMGCLLHWMLVGESPLATPQARRSAFAGDDVALDPSLPKDVATIVRRATFGDRDARYANAAAMGVHIASVFVDSGVIDPRARLRRFMKQLRAASAAAPPKAMRDLFDPSLLGESPAVSFEDRTHVMAEDLSTDSEQTDRAEAPFANTVPTALPITGPTMAPPGPTVAAPAPSFLDSDEVSPLDPLGAGALGSAPTVAQRPVSAPGLLSWTSDGMPAQARPADAALTTPATGGILDDDTDPATAGGQQTELELQLRSDAGRVIHGYRLTERIARGSKSVVYAATHETLGFEYCVCIVARRPQDLAEAERIRDVAQRVGRLRQPHVAPVIDFGFLEDGRPFSTMARIEGQSIAELGPRAIPWAQLRTWVLDLARALQASHEVGVIHGDVEPSNVLVRDNEVRLVGFDIARPDTTTPADDVFGLSAIATRLVENGRAKDENFPAETRIPEAFRALIERMADARAAQRPTMSQVIAALEDIPSAPRDPASLLPLDPEPGPPATQPGALVEAEPARARSPWGLVLLLVALATIAGVVTFEILA